MPQGRRRFCIPMCDPVNYPHRHLSIDPYALGVILGDGSVTRHGSAHVTTDDAIIKAIVGDAEHTISDHESEGISVLWTRHWQQELLALDLAGKRSWEKRVPAEYLHASIEQRKALLAGLVDTDGHPMVSGGVEFSSASEALTSAVAELAESLGGTARRRSPKKTWYVKDGRRVECRDSWIVNIKLPFNPFRLARKAEKWVPPTKYPPARWIESIQADEDEESVCISVEAPDGLYLTRHHIVTHNTHVALALMALMIEDGLIDRVLVFCERNKVDEWMADIDEFTEFDAIRYMGPPEARKKRLLKRKESSHVLVSPYHTGREDMVGDQIGKRGAKFEEGFLLEALRGERLLIVYDEVTVLGGRTSTLHKVHQFFAHTTNAYLLGLTATPITNGPESYYNLGRIFCPDLVGTVEQFYKAHARRFNGFHQVMQWKDLDGFAAKMAPVVVRKRKTDPDVIDQFPKEVEDFIKTPLSPEHKALYDHLEALAMEIPEEKRRYAFNLLCAFANHPRSIFFSNSELARRFTEEVSYSEVEKAVCSKSISVIQKLRQIVSQGDQVVLFCDSVMVLDELARDISEDKLLAGTYRLYHGGVAHETREQSKLEFKAGAARILLCSSAGERGINLPEASYIINYDVPTQISSYIQRLSRASRIGANAGGILMIITYLAADTAEVGAAKVLMRRNAQSDVLIDSDVDPLDEYFTSVADRRRMIKGAKKS